MDRSRLPSAGEVQRLSPGQAVLSHARASTWLQVRRGVLVVQPAPHWLAERALDLPQRVPAGAGYRVEASGWLRLRAEGGVVELCCRRPPVARARSWSEWIAATWRTVTRRIAAS